MRYLNDPVLVAANLATDQASGPIDASFIIQVSGQAVVAGSSPVGTIKLQCSNDKIKNADTAQETPPTHWSDIPNTTVSVNATGTWLIPKVDICYQWIRFVWTATSGTGAITANIKTVGI